MFEMLDLSIINILTHIAYLSFPFSLNGGDPSFDNLMRLNWFVLL